MHDWTEICRQCIDDMAMIFHGMVWEHPSKVQLVTNELISLSFSHEIG